MKEAIEARAAADACQVRLTDAQAEAQAFSDRFVACQAELKTCVPPAPPPSMVRPLLGYSAGVVSTVLLVTGLVAPLPDSARLALGGVGLAGLAGGLVLVVWR